MTLLGQNVNSYRDISVADDDEDSIMQLSAGWYSPFTLILILVGTK